MRVIFDTITRALFQTEYHEGVRSLFRGFTTRYKTCTVCGEVQKALRVLPKNVMVFECSCGMRKRNGKLAEF